MPNFTATYLDGDTFGLRQDEHYQARTTGDGAARCLSRESRVGAPVAFIALFASHKHVLDVLARSSGAPSGPLFVASVRTPKRDQTVCEVGLDLTSASDCRSQAKVAFIRTGGTEQRCQVRDTTPRQWLMSVTRQK